MPYIDAYPNATNLRSTDIVILGQSGTPNAPGSAITKQATLAQLFGLAGTGTIGGPATFIATQNNATLGVELTTNGGLVGSLTGWTAGTGWAYGSNSAVWTVGTSGSLTQMITVVSGASYVVQWDQTNSVYANGNITPALGAASGLAFNLQVTTPNLANQQVITTLASGPVTLSFTGSAVGTPSGTITIKNISVKQLTPQSATLTLRNVGGIADNQIFPGGAGLNNLFMGQTVGQYNLGTGYQNSGFGSATLSNLTTGFGNSAFGSGALTYNTIGTNNTAVGRRALNNNIMGHDNTAMGLNCLGLNTTGSENTAYGTSALQANTTGWSNTALGDGALASNTTGTGSVAVGENALLVSNSSQNTVIGFQAGGILTSGGANIMLGYFTATTNLTTGSSNILIGNYADTPAAGTNNYLNIANVFSVSGLDVPATSVAAFTGTLSVTSGAVIVGTNTSTVGNNVIVNGAAGSARSQLVQTAGLFRWQWGATGAAESGANAGSDWFLARFNDAGTFIDNPIQVTRSTGVVSFQGPASLNAAVIVLANQTNGLHSILNLTPRFAGGGQGIIQTTNASPITLGANSTTVVTIDSTKLTALVLQTMSTSGPTWTAGTGAPATTQPLGSMFSRTDGGVGTTLYVSRGAGTWNAVAGV